MSWRPFIWPIPARPIDLWATLWFPLHATLFLLQNVTDLPTEALNGGGNIALYLFYTWSGAVTVAVYNKVYIILYKLPHNIVLCYVNILLLKGLYEIRKKGSGFIFPNNSATFGYE